MTQPTQDQIEWAKWLTETIAVSYHKDREGIIATALAEREADGWNHNMEDAKALPKDTRIYLRVGDQVFSPCWWSPAGEINEDGVWCWEQAPAAWFTLVADPTAFKPITLPPAKETE